MPVSTIGDGLTIAFGTSSFSANVDSCRWTGQSREAIDLSHIGTTAGMPFAPSKMYDPGSLQLELHHDPDITIPLVGEAEEITVTFPLRSGTTAASFVCSGFVTGYEFGAEKRGKVTASMTVKITGTPTFTAEA